MKTIDYFDSENREYWLEKIGESDWDGGRFLYELLKSERLPSLVGDNVKVLLLTEDEKLISFCTLAQMDDIQPTELGPWIGWIYTFLEYRGRRYAGRLLDYAEELARIDGAESVYISTNHEGLYEKYGYVFYGIFKDIEGSDSRVYMKKL